MPLILVQTARQRTFTRRFTTLFAIILIGILSIPASAQPAPIATSNAATLTQAAVLGHGEANDLAFAPHVAPTT